MGQVVSRAPRRSRGRRLGAVKPRWIRRQLGRCWGLSGLSLLLLWAMTYGLSAYSPGGLNAASIREATAGRHLATAPAPIGARHGPPAPPRAPHRSHLVGASSPPVRSTGWPPPVHLPAQMESGPSAATQLPAPTRYLTPRLIPPETARYLVMRAHHYGRVVLGVRLSPNGRVSGLWLQQPSGDQALDQYALLRVRDWQFAPPPVEDDTGLLALRFEPKQP